MALAVTQRPAPTPWRRPRRSAASWRYRGGLPKGIKAEIAYDPTRFVSESVRDLVMTIGEAVALVVLVVLLFLQNWRAALIPILAIPVSLIGTFGVMLAFGFTLNVLTLFGLVLAVGIVVEDATWGRRGSHLRTERRPGPPPPMLRWAGRCCPSAVLCAGLCRPPPDHPGRFFRQFAVTLAGHRALGSAR